MASEEHAAILLGAPNPPMFYDYYGFPREAYTITHPAPGHPALAERIASLLEKNHISSWAPVPRYPWQPACQVGTKYAS